MPIVKLCEHQGVIFSLYPELPEGVTEILHCLLPKWGFSEQISGSAWKPTEFNQPQIFLSILEPQTCRYEEVQEVDVNGKCMVQGEKQTVQHCKEEHRKILPLEEEMDEEDTDKWLCNKHCHWLVPTPNTFSLCQFFIPAFSLWLSSRRI